MSAQESRLAAGAVGRDADARTELEAAAAIPPDDPETKLALAQVYGRLGEKSQAQELMKGLTGSAGGDSGPDIFAAALKNDIDPTQTENDAQQVLYDIGGQFDSGELDRLGPSAFSSMRLVALAWSRIGMGEISARRKSGSDAVSNVGVALEPVGNGGQPAGAGTRKARPDGKGASYVRAGRGSGWKR